MPCLMTLKSFAVSTQPISEEHSLTSSDVGVPSDQDRYTA